MPHDYQQGFIRRFTQMTFEEKEGSGIDFTANNSF